MAPALALYRSTIGKKVAMALTGLILVGFVVAHMLGNLKIFTGSQHLNEYGEFLRTVGEPLFPYSALLWIARIVLLGSVVVHIVAATQLTMLDRASRPERYVFHKKQQATYASLTMRWGGLIILLFVIYHILHFTTGAAHGNFIEGDVYHNVVSGFQVWYVSVVYIAAMVALGFHLYHGVWSMFQTLGLNSSKWNGLLRGLSVLTALVVAGGNILIPVAVLAGFLS
ncbi:MAG: succinate dehydrogenase cytochrome b subunit [Chloroflexota bacterium]|nr:succinate dehydrogenase cytochrome b subunit [Chloroflexota bacterium]